MFCVRDSGVQIDKPDKRWKDLSNDITQVYTKCHGHAKCYIIKPIIPSQCGTKWWYIQCCHLYFIGRILDDAIHCYATLNMTDLLLSEKSFILEIYHSIGKFSQIKYFKYVQASQHSVRNTTGLNIFKTWLPAIQGYYLESTCCVVSGNALPEKRCGYPWPC